MFKTICFREPEEVPYTRQTQARVQNLTRGYAREQVKLRYGYTWGQVNPLPAPYVTPLPSLVLCIWLIKQQGTRHVDLSFEVV